ncbi:DUF4291 family protein [Streptomyces sp. NBC_01320]|uniref:DUF4291 family protein n=1 Tax=Streptomyces sp. NBC_01320 TaxID=2903824 RepID=UPI003FA38788
MSPLYGIRAHYDARTIVVYQAYSPAVAGPALRACRVTFDRIADAVWCVRFQGGGMSS